MAGHDPGVRPLRRLAALRALVTNLDWVRHAAKALGWLMGGQLRVFEIDELKAAAGMCAADD